MINLTLTNDQAIQLHLMLKSLPLLVSEHVPASIKQDLQKSFADNLHLANVAGKLKTELDNLLQIQNERMESSVFIFENKEAE